MRRRESLVLNLGLALAAAWLGWRLVAEWRQLNELRYRRLAQTGAGTPAPLLPGPLAAPLVAGGELVAHNPFSPDRTSTLPEQEASPSASALPVVFGTINLGAHYEALMAEGDQAARGFRRFRQGERIGPYTVVEIGDDRVVIEHEGQRTTLNVYQSAKSVSRAQAKSTPAAAPVVEASGATPSQPVPVATVPAPSSTAGSSAAAQPAPPGVRVTIEGNRKRYERQTPFGPQVWYEEIR